MPKIMKCYVGFVIILLIVLLVFIPACSSSPGTPSATAAQVAVSGTPKANPSAKPAVAVLGTAPVSAVPGVSDMVEYFLSNGNLTIFTTALVQTNLFGELRGKGPYTAFVPTDEAFLKLTPGAKNIIKDNAKLKELMLYHLVHGEYTAPNLPAVGTLKTLQGGDLHFQVVNYELTVNGAKFVLTDVQATDGVIHIIDKVLLLPEMNVP
jgi:uncharacterized surface protein with fasciclin (FAS1) repeats